MLKHITATLLAISSACLAQPIRTVQYDAVSGMFVDVASSQEPATQVTLFDSWHFPFEGGATEYRGNVLTGFDVTGEDMIGANGQGGIVTDIGYSLANLSTTRSIRFNRITYSFWTLDGALIASRSRDELFAVPIRPGELVQSSFGAEQFRAFNVAVPDRFYMTIQRESFDNVPASTFGTLWGSPITTGSSSQFYRNFTTGQDIDLGMNQGTLMMYVKTDPIPSPSAVSLLVSSSLLALRRGR